MRRLPFSLLLGVVLVSSLAFAAPTKPTTPPTTKSKIQHEPLPTARADVSLVGKATFAKELPKALPAGDRTKLEAAAAELKEDHFEAGAGLFRQWATSGPKQLTHEDATLTALWLFREGILTKHEEMMAAADQLRWLDERNAAIDDSLALLKGAVITKKPALVAKIVVLTPYVRDARGDERKERQINRDTLGAEIKELEAVQEKVRNKREEARSGFSAVDSKANQTLQMLTSLIKTVNPTGRARVRVFS